MDTWLSIWGGGALVNRRLTKAAVLLTHELVMQMDEWGVKWVKENGRIYRERSGGTGTSDKINCLMAEGGPQFMMAVRRKALDIGVQVLNRTMVTDVLTSDGQQPTKGAVMGAVGFDTRSGAPRVFQAKATIICAGPYRFPFPTHSTTGLHGMPIDVAPDGQAMMMRAGAAMGKLEVGGLSPAPRESFSAPGLEILGGLGCRFVNEQEVDILRVGSRDGEMGMWGRRSAISHAIAREVQAGRRVYLDIRHFTPEQMRLAQQVIPIVMANYRMNGFDPERDLIPYTSFLPITSGVSGGGACVNERGETTVQGLYAAGNDCDAAYLAMGQQLPGAAVSGCWAGEYAARDCLATFVEPNERQVSKLLDAAVEPLQRLQGENYEPVHDAIEEVVETALGRVLSGERIQQARLRIQGIEERRVRQLRARDIHDLAKVHGLKNFCEMARAVLLVMEHRQESRGNILREDYPYTDNERWLCYTRLKRNADGSYDIWDEPRPNTDDYINIPRTREMHPYFARSAA